MTFAPASSSPATAPEPGGIRLTTSPLAPGQAFGPRYRILKLLGAGGMGAVYQAWDNELNVAVALKVIRPEVTSGASATPELERRFKQELLLARQVTHKHVVRIHDLGEINGIKYITMPYIEGADLATVLRDKGKLAVPEALRIAKQIAAGLQAAHEAGVVHRDLKPANIMIEGDHALIMDFGIARSTSRAGQQTAAGTGVGPGAADLAGLTVVGAVIGTLEYMAPEQAKGEPADQRVDIYAFGLIFYDMLLGARVARASTARGAGGPASASAKRGAGVPANQTLEELQQRMEQAPPSPRSIDAGIPEAVDQIVMRCLQPDPAARYQTTAELVAALDRLDADGQPLPEPKRISRRQMAAALALVLALLTGTWWLARTPAPPPELEPVSVLIADFENRTNDPVFGEVLEQALAIGIEGASFIGAYPRVDAVRLLAQLAPGHRLDLERARLLAGREGIKVVLAGAIDPRGSGYRLTVRAIDPAPGIELARVEASASDKGEVLQKLGEIASDLRSELGDTTPESARLAELETFTSTSLDAARSYSQGQELQWSSKYEESIPFYKKALEADPNFGRAYSNWAVSAFYLGRKDEADELYKKAFALIDRMTDREKYRTYGSYFLTVARNYERAIENYEKLVELYPADRSGHGNLAVAYFSTLNFAKASDEGRKAMQLYPASLKLRNNFALYAMYGADFATAAKEAEEVVKADSTYYRAYLPIAVAAFARGDLQAARTAYDRMAQASRQGASVANMGLADIALYEGRFADAAAILREGIALDESIRNRSGQAAKLAALAEGYLGLGDVSQAAANGRRAAKLLAQEAVLLPVGRIMVQAGREAEARAIQNQLSAQIHPYSRAYGSIVSGEIALRNRRMPEAVDAFEAAQKLADLWLARFALGVGYVQAGHYAEGLAELEACVKRRGEATALFLDDVPTVRYLAPLHYWLGRAQEGVGSKAAAAESYKTFLAQRPGASRDPLLVDARRRLGSR